MVPPGSLFPHWLDDGLKESIERAVCAHLGRAWSARSFTDLGDRASHPCGIVRGEGFAVFVKYGDAGHFGAELAGLTLLRSAGASTPAPIDVAEVAASAAEPTTTGVLLLEAIDEIPAERRTPQQWRAIGRALARLHGVRGETFGLKDFDGYFGPLPQDNQPTGAGTWPDFYAQRRLAPGLRMAADSGNLPRELVAGVEGVIGKLPQLCGPVTVPVMIHGDAQQNNFLTAAEDGEAVMFDAAPYYGHPEMDLALLDYFAPVPGEVFEGYRELAPIDPGFGQRRELWRLYGYLAVVTVDGRSAFGRQFVEKIAKVVGRYGRDRRAGSVLN